MQIEHDIYSRLLPIYGPDKLKQFFKSKVVVLGLGGVGSYCACALARSGIGNMVLVDYDKVEQSNINRQLFALQSSVGENKVDVAKNYIGDISSSINIETHQLKISHENIGNICQGADYVVDAIDDVPAKIAVAKYCQDAKIPIVSCMGTALRTKAENFQFSDIYKTSVCPLCKSVRKLAKECGIEKLEVLFSTQPAIKPYNNSQHPNTLGSTSYIPPIAGMMLAGHVLENL